MTTVGKGLIKLDVHALYEYTACMNGLQYTIRNVSPEIDRVMRSRLQPGKSLNDVLLEALRESAGQIENHDLDFLFGSWVDDPECDAVIADQRKIDWDLWR